MVSSGSIPSAGMIEAGLPPCLAPSKKSRTRSQDPGLGLALLPHPIVQAVHAGDAQERKPGPRVLRSRGDGVEVKLLEKELGAFRVGVPDQVRGHKRDGAHGWAPLKQAPYLPSDKKAPAEA
jgi:hypothetical protein